MSELVVTQVRSSIGTKPKHRGTLRALGLGRIGKSNTLPDRPEIRGMIAKVPHLVVVDEAGSQEAPQKATPKTAQSSGRRPARKRGVERAEGGAAGGGTSTEAKE
jgi:large subunit ribosomal protein L30